MSFLKNVVGARLLCKTMLLRVQGQVLIHDSVNAMDLCGIVHFRKLVELKLRIKLHKHIAWCRIGFDLLFFASVWFD